MSTVSPAASTPPRRRGGEGQWGAGYPHEHDSPLYGPQSGPPRGPGAYYGGPPPGYGGQPPPPPSHQTGTSDYWSYDHGPPRGGYWGPPPPAPYDSFSPSSVDRSMPPPSRGQPRPPMGYEHESPLTARLRIPHSPGRYTRGPPPLQPSRHGDFIPPPPRTTASNKEEKSGKDKRKGDPLSILANVSAGMTSKDKKKQQQQQQLAQEPSQTEAPRPVVPIPAPTSPLQRRSRPSPITPNHHTSPGNTPRLQRHHEVTPLGPAGTTPRTLEQHPSWDFNPEPGYAEHPPPPGYYPPRRRYPGYEYPPRYPDPGPPPSSPALVERGSFESQGGDPYQRQPAAYGGPPPQYQYDDYSYGYWEGAPQSYPPPRYNHYDWGGGYEPRDDGYGQPYRSPTLPPPAPLNPYTIVQQPRLEEKTVLRKKFSWKHYPELERFLIANRDEYLKHSNMNYTAEQKQYNNWLTERLLELANKHNYVFDHDDFNFVSIRDRIRCYYKSYVQTARKRGLKLPEKKKD